VPLDALPDPQPSDYEFAAEILVRLRVFAPVLTYALVDTLGRCDKRQLLTLFGIAAGEIVDPEPEPEPAPPPPKPCHDPSTKPGVRWTWDGRRVPPKPSSLPPRDPSHYRNDWRVR
jgi:hypothetical protein